MRIYLGHAESQPIKVAVEQALEELLGDALNYAESHGLDDDAVEREVADIVYRWATAIQNKHFPLSKGNGVEL